MSLILAESQSRMIFRKINRLKQERNLLSVNKKKQKNFVN